MGTMLFLADESCDACMVRILRAVGHDVMAVARAHQGASDTDVIDLAVGTSRILITEDKDFGQLVYASGHGHSGVILLRYPFQLRHHIAQSLSALVRDRGDALAQTVRTILPAER